MPIQYIRNNPATEAFERVTARGENQRRYDKQEAERDRTRQQQEGVDQAIRGPLADIYAGKDAPEAKLIQGLAQAPGGGAAALQTHQNYNVQQERDEAKRWDLFIDTLKTNPEIAARIRAADPELSQLPESIITDARQRVALIRMREEAEKLPNVNADNPQRYEAYWAEMLPQVLGAENPLVQTVANLPPPTPKAPSTTGAKMVRTPDGNLTWAIPGQAIPAGAQPIPTSTTPTTMVQNLDALVQRGIAPDQATAFEMLNRAKSSPAEREDMIVRMADSALKGGYAKDPGEAIKMATTEIDALLGSQQPGMGQPGVNFTQPVGTQPGGVPAPQGAPPIEGAEQAPDGNWYIQQNGRWFRVEP